jgi:SAM-dependent methyltransferase
MTKFLIGALFCASFASGSGAPADHYVSHKDEQLEIYLDMIAAHLEEKTEIVQHIKKNPSGTYLDVGTGGDGIAAILRKIGDSTTTTLIAGDIDSQILENIPKRHPEILKYLIASSVDTKETKLFLKELDATQLKEFKDNSLDGINASALVHEIVSYAGGYDGIRRFAKELCRVLVPGGIFVYRDPESVYNRNEMISANILALPLKYFANIFLPKFLDRKFSKKGGKHDVYPSKDIFFEFYKKNESKITLADYETYIKIPTKDIDFQRPYNLILTRALCQELERHYLMFLHEYASLLFIKGQYDFEKNSYKIAFRAPRAHAEFLSYCKKLDIPVNDGAIAVNDYQKLQVYQMSIPNNLGEGLKLLEARGPCLQRLQEIYERHGFDFETSIDKKTDIRIFDYKVLVFLWHELKPIFSDAELCSIAEDSRHLLDWLQREGEEVYYYASPDEFIMFMGKESMTTIDGQVYMLAPLSPKYNKSIVRQGYSSFLAESLIVTNESGAALRHDDRKRIIHFGKMTIDEALARYKEIIADDAEHNQALFSFVAALKEMVN